MSRHCGWASNPSPSPRPSPSPHPRPHLHPNPYPNSCPYPNQALRLGIGRLLAHIVATLDHPDGKLHLYSGHDWTVGPLLMCLCPATEALLKTWPPFCAELAVELWSDETELASGDGGAARARESSRYVRVLYNGARIPHTQGTVVARWGAVRRGGVRWRVPCACARCRAICVPCCVRACVQTCVPPSHPSDYLGAPLDLQCSAEGNGLCRLADFKVRIL